MAWKLIEWNIQFTVLTELSPLTAGIFMLVHLSNPELFLAELASCLLVELFFMFFLTVNVVHLSALCASLYIPSAVPKVGCHF